MTSQQLNELVAQTPLEPTRAPKPKLEDFTEYSEEGAKTVRTDDFKQALKDWTEQERDFISDPQHISDMTSTLKGIKSLFYEYRDLYLNEQKAKVGDTPKSVPPLETAKIIYKLLTVIKLDNEDGLLGVYNPESGIYETSEKFFHRLIYWIEPTYSQARSKEVLFKLETLSEVKAQTVKPYLIPVANGIFNKKTQKLEPFNPKHIFTSTIATKYNPQAKSPDIKGWNVDKWFSELMSDDELVRLLWQIISASTNGNYSYRKGVWFVGKGNDGKGTVQSLIMNLIGRENVASVKAEQFSERFALSQVVGKTCIIGDDSQVNYLDNAGNYFSVITGDPVPIEVKGKTPTLALFNKLIIQSANFLPKFRNKSNGTYRRMLIVPFNKSYTAETDNWKIKDDYIKRPEVLEYVLKKALSLNFDRFIEPKATQELLEEFKITNDTVLAFVSSDFQEFVSDFLPTTFITAYYQAWCEVEGVKPFSKREFELKLPDHIKEEWEKTRQRSSSAGFNRAVDLHRAEELPKFRALFYWNDEKHRQSVKGYKRKKES